jgi:dUTP pyrophosphatase
MESQQYGFLKVEPEATIPTRGTPGSAGYDLYAAADYTIVGGKDSVIVQTGIAAKIPPGCYVSIRERSGLAVKENIAVGAGVVDRDYWPRPIGVVLYCTKPGHKYEVKKGDRIAQAIIERVAEIPMLELKGAPKDIGDHDGFGSTGK